MIAHGRDANSRAVCAGDTVDRGPRRNKITEIKLHKRGRKIYVSVASRIDSHTQDHIARARLEAFRGLKRSWMSDQHELSAKARCERAPERDHHDPACGALYLTGDRVRGVLRHEHGAPQFAGEDEIRDLRILGTLRVGEIRS